MSDHEAEALYRQAVMAYDEIYRTKNAIDHLRREAAGYEKHLEDLLAYVEVLSDTAWKSHGAEDTSLWANDALASVLIDERVRFDDC